MKNDFLLTTALLVVLFLSSCSEQSDPSFDQENFTAIYDDNQFMVEHTPIDVKETTDGSYIILAERRLIDSNLRGIYLLKTDKTGKYVSSIEMEDNYINPVGDLHKSGAQFSFFCMEAFDQSVQRVTIDPVTDELIITPLQNGLTYPTAAFADETETVLLSYDNFNKESIVSRYSPGGGMIGSPRRFSIGTGDGVEEPIMNHFLHTGKRFPFQVGKISGGGYFFNGFENYTFSLVFTDMANDGADGVVQGQQDDGGLSAVYPLGASKFAVARFDFGDSYFLPNAILATSGPTQAINLGGNPLPELVSNARVKILRATIGERSVLVFASNTKSKQIGLFFYDELTGEFMSSRYLGFSNPFEISNLIQTADNGLAVVGTTYLAGRFARICLIKISDSDVARQVN